MRDAGIGAGDAFEIFGQRGGPAFEVLSSTLPRIRQLTDILNQAEGTVEDIAEIMDANLNGALLRVRSAIEAVVLSFSQGAFSSGLQTILNRIAQGTRFLAANIEIVQGLVAGLATATLPLLVRGLTVLLRLAIRNPFAVLAVGAGTALGSMVAFGDQMRINERSTTTFRDVAIAAARIVGETWPIVWQNVLDVLGDFGNYLLDLPKQTSYSLEDVLKIAAAFGDGFVATFRGIGAVLQDVWNRPLLALEAAFKGTVNAIITTAEFLIDGVVAVLSGLGTSIDVVTRRLGLVVQYITAALEAGSMGDYDTSAQFFREAAFSAQRAFSEGFGDLGKNISREWTELREEDFLALLPNEAAEKLGTSFGEVWQQAFEESTQITGFVERTLALADLVRQERDSNAALGQAERDPTVFNPYSDDTLSAAERELRLLSQINQELDTQAALVSLTADAREREQKLNEFDDRFLAQNVVMVGSVREELEARLLQIEAIARQRDLIDEIRGPMEDLVLKQSDLNDLFSNGAITLDEYNKKLEELQLAILESGTSVETGFARGFIRVQNSLQDFAGLAEQTLVGAFQAAEDALVEFATTGEFNFSKLVDSILSDVARLLARQALSGFLGALTGGAFGFEGTAGDFFFGGGKAAGGPVMNDRSYLVGERGPEMFTPSVPGQITPAPQTAAMMAPQAPPQVNVQVVNVTDPEEVSAALNTPGTQDQIVNVIRRNRQSVRSALGI